MAWILRLRRLLAAGSVAALIACGARTDLLVCREGAVESCGSDVGACRKGTHTCVGGAFGPCVGGVEPTEEKCNGIDDNCDGQVDEGFHLGEPCDGPDTDLCLDDIMTCDGCSAGPNNVEICNGIDDNCNGIIDADCEVGDCKPTLTMIDSTPSDPSCIDFPVMAGATGTIEYPCGGGPVTAKLGDVSVMGSVVNGFVSLDGTLVVPPDPATDNCAWQTNHHIEGVIASGTLQYSYSEMPVSGTNCWTPCTESGTVEVKWSP